MQNFRRGLYTFWCSSFTKLGQYVIPHAPSDQVQHTRTYASKGSARGPRRASLKKPVKPGAQGQTFMRSAIKRRDGRIPILSKKSQQLRMAHMHICITGRVEQTGLTFMAKIIPASSNNNNFTIRRWSLVWIMDRRCHWTAFFQRKGDSWSLPTNPPNWLSFGEFLWPKITQLDLEIYEYSRTVWFVFCGPH